MSVEIAWKQNILVTDFHLLKSLLVVFGFGSQAFVCGFSRQNINSVTTFGGFKNKMIIIFPIWKITTIPLFSVPGQAKASQYFGPHKAKDNSTKKTHSSVQVK